MRTLRPGAWYLVYTCEACHNKQILFPDLTDGKTKLLVTYGVICPECGHHGKYDGEKIERYQHATEPSGI